MSDDALAYLVEAFGHVSETELRSFLDAVPAAVAPASDRPDVAPVIAVQVEAREPAQAA